MLYWHVRLRKRSAGWYWECRTRKGMFLCSSPLSFKYRWEALRNFERWFEDYWAMNAVLTPDFARTDAEWVCGS